MKLSHWIKEKLFYIFIKEIKSQFEAVIWAKKVYYFSPRLNNLKI